jgi:hypothetical protein
MNVITTPSPTTVALCTQLGWSRVPVGEWDRSQFWIVDHRKALQSYVESKTSTIVANVASVLASPLLFMKDVMAERRYSPTDDYRLEWCDSFDERFDCFWKELNNQYPDRLLSARDTATLQWHFKSALQERRLWILAASTGSHLIGYAILDRRDIAALDLTRVLLQDFQALRSDAALCSSMIYVLLQRCRREGIHILENIGCWMEKLQPARNAPYRRHLGSWCYLYRIKNESLERSLRRAASWYPTQYDGDASI